MSQALTVSTNKQGDTLTYTLVGAMDENAIYPAVADAGIKHVVFDFGGVDLINSTGLQAWTKFLQSVPAVASVVFQNCSQRVVNQINLFPGFTAGKKLQIKSFYAPYFCDACDASRNVLLSLNDVQSEIAQGNPPERKCDKCGKIMEFDSIPKKYFLFAKS